MSFKRILMLAGALALTIAATAQAAGKVIKVGTPLSNDQPAVAVDSAGTAYLAWANTKDTPPNTTDFVQYCVLPKGATACSHSGSLTPADAAQHIDNVQILSDGSTIVLLADVYGTAASGLSDYEPEQEWQSTDGGATWSIVGGGLSIASGILNADTMPLNAVILPGTGVLGYGWETAAGPPTFNAFALSSPPECSVNTCPAGFATLEPNTNPDILSNGGGQIAAQQGAFPGLLAIYQTDFTAGPFGCSPSQTVPFGTAYAYGSGPESASNDYNISPGMPNSAWKVAASLADCNVEYPAVAGGPSGFGVLEQNDLKGTTVYHRFNQSTSSFAGNSMVTVANEHEIDPAVSQDGSGGVYATFLGGGDGGPVSLAYSSNGGNSWIGPATLTRNTSTGIFNVTSMVNPTGQGWASWTDNGAVYAQPFQAVDALVPAAVGGAGASSGGKTATITVTCSSFPCTVTLTLSAPTTILVHGRNASPDGARGQDQDDQARLRQADDPLTRQQEADGEAQRRRQEAAADQDRSRQADGALLDEDRTPDRECDPHGHAADQVAAASTTLAKALKAGAASSIWAGRRASLSSRKGTVS